MKIIDKRDSLKIHLTRKYSKRDMNRITSIAIHHSATLQGSAEAFANYHVSHNGWPGIGYTYVINKNGEVIQCWDWDVKTAHVGNSNRYALGICLVGDFTKEEPNEDQLQAAADLCMYIIDKLDSVKEIKPHSDYPGYSWKTCPNFDVMQITNRMSVFKL